jgi:hypothetical protein
MVLIVAADHQNAPAEGPGRGAKDQDFGPQGRGPKGGMVDPDMQASPTFGGPAYPPMMPGQVWVCCFVVACIGCPRAELLPQSNSGRDK